MILQIGDIQANELGFPWYAMGYIMVMPISYEPPKSLKPGLPKDPRANLQPISTNTANTEQQGMQRT